MPQLPVRGRSCPASIQTGVGGFKHAIGGRAQLPRIRRFVYEQRHLEPCSALIGRAPPSPKLQLGCCLAVAESGITPADPSIRASRERSLPSRPMESSGPAPRAPQRAATAQQLQRSHTSAAICEPRVSPPAHSRAPPPPGSSLRPAQHGAARQAAAAPCGDWGSSRPASLGSQLGGGGCLPAQRPGGPSARAPGCVTWCSPPSHATPPLCKGAFRLKAKLQSPASVTA